MANAAVQVNDKTDYGPTCMCTASVAACRALFVESFTLQHLH